ncbi:MAG: ATP-dependent RecD-like DNA helicase [Eubacteriales bacterium]|nr:ATP-dependent RecD-like DNA helicase [Eubacteriales bacterium]
MERLSGVVERITFSNEENGFCVIKIKAKEHKDLVTVVGNLASVSIGSVLELSGKWKTDSRFGAQFCVDFYKETLPATIAGLEKYLGSGLIKGIGPVFARRIVGHFKEETLKILDMMPDLLTEVEGLGPSRIEKIKTAWEEQKEIKNVMIFLQGHGVSTAYAVKIFKRYGNRSIDLVKENPFRLADDIWGIGFKTADRIAGKLGYEGDSPERIKAGIVYTLGELSDDGHCFAFRDQLSARCSEILQLEERQISASIDGLIDEKILISQDHEETGSKAIYLPAFFYSEEGTAKRISEIIAGKSRVQVQSAGSINKIILNIEKEAGFSYDDVQKNAIRKAAASKFMVLTGGPGTGKTTTTLAILKVFRKLGADCLLAAPTGRAAKRLSETTGSEAKTIHRLLEYKPPEGYKRNSSNPLKCDVLIIDETSMVDIVLMNNLLKATPDEAAVILVGDVDQLPSVGPGNVLRDIISSGKVEVVELKRIFRQAMGSKIITNAHKINRGEMPWLKGGSESDFFFIEESEPARVAEIITELCTKRLPPYYSADPISDIQVLCPMQKGDTGTVKLNEMLQEALNSKKEGAPFLQYGGRNYRIGDKVMQIRNNYEKNVFNGDIGIITGIDMEDRTLVTDFYGNETEYDINELDELVVAYATTVHKSQGSEFPIVVAPLTTQHFLMLQRNLLYTCITRARKAFVLVGTKKAVSISVSNNKIRLRNTMLKEKISCFCQGTQSSFSSL